MSQIPSQNGTPKENYTAHQDVIAETHLGSSSESKVVMETTRTTSATMRMEHKTNFPDLPVTFSQRTQTPTIPMMSEGTMVDSGLKRVTKSQTESTQTQLEPLRPAAPFVQSVPFPFIEPSTVPITAQAPQPVNTSAKEFFETNLKNLPPLQQEKYTRYEDIVKGSKTYVHKQNEFKEQFHSKLHNDLSYLNLVPEPPPEMGFMPKVQKSHPEKLVEKVKKLEEVHQSSETPLSGTVFPQSFKKEQTFERQEVLSSKTVSSSPFLQQKPASPLPQRPIAPQQKKPFSPLPNTPRPYTPQMNRDQLFTAEPKITRSPSPKPSTEAVNMEKLWTSTKSPEPFSQHQQQSFSHEQKSSFVAYSSSQTNVHQTLQQEVLPSKEQFVPIQPHADEPPKEEEVPKVSIKDTKNYFEQRIKQEEVKSAPSDLKAPGLVRQFAKPMVPLVPLDLEPGSPPEICYAPKPVYERKQSYVEKIEKSLEQNIEKEPDRIPEGGVRIFPQRQTPQRTSESPQKVQHTPSFKPVLPQAPPVVHNIVAPGPTILPSPKTITEPFVPYVPPLEQFQSKEFKSEHFEIKNESSTGYRHVEPPKFLQSAKSSDSVPVPQAQFEAPPKLPEPFVRKPDPVYQHPPREVPIAIQKPEPVKPVFQQPKPEPVKPVLQQHKPVSQPKPYVKAKQKFNDFVSETHGSQSLYKDFVRSEESTHSSESYFQKLEQSNLAQAPQPQFMKQEPPRQQFVPPPQQVRKKFPPDVML